jgi:hypothetical protein
MDEAIALDLNGKLTLLLWPVREEVVAGRVIMLRMAKVS